MLSPMYRFFPARAPRGAAAAPKPSSEQFEPNDAQPGDFTIGQLDTGVVLQDGTPHPWLAGHVSYGASDRDTLDALTVRPDGSTEQRPDGRLDESDAHGSFVAGLMLQQAPQALVVVRAVLDDGTGDDHTVADAIRALATTNAQVITLAFSGFPSEEARPKELEAALDALDPEVVVVAAAGNLGTAREVWPAAFSRVIAVGAVDTTEDVPADAAPPRAAFSSYGKWVDAYARGVDVLGPYVAFTEPDAGYGVPGRQFDGWATWSGTSFAAAKVAGKIAQVAITEGISAMDAAARVLQGPPVEIAGMPPWTWKPYVTTD